MTKVLMVVAPKNFRDTEYFVTKRMLEEANHVVETASKVTGEITGFEGRILNPDHRLVDIDPEEYDAIIYIGGQGMNEYLSDEEFTRQAKRFFELKKLVAAICIAPAVLANAGILQGKKVTSWDGVKDLLISKGVIYTGSDVEIDSNVITAIGPAASEAFGLKICEYLTKISS
jgi:protease I